MHMDYHSEDFLGLGNIKPLKKCFKHLLSKNSNESCGILIYKNDRYDYDYIELENLNKFYKDQFTARTSTFNKYYLSNRVISICHSHDTDSPEPSEIDIEISESLGLPSFILSTKTKESYLYYPSSYKPIPLSGRIFIPMFQDCMTFVKDFYEIELNIKLSKKIRNWSRSKNESNINLMKEINANFNLVNTKKLKLGDLMIFENNPSGLFHLGVVDSKGMLYHHGINLFPNSEFITASTADKVYKLYRYKDL